MKTRIVKETISNKANIYDEQYRCEIKIWFWWSTMKKAEWDYVLREFLYKDAIFSSLEEAQAFLRVGQIKTIRQIVE